MPRGPTNGFNCILVAVRAMLLGLVVGAVVLSCADPPAVDPCSEQAVERPRWSIGLGETPAYGVVIGADGGAAVLHDSAHGLLLEFDNEGEELRRVMLPPSGLRSVPQDLDILDGFVTVAALTTVVRSVATAIVSAAMIFCRATAPA